MAPVAHAPSFRTLRVGLDGRLGRLTLDQRSVVVLHHYLDLPLDRVAEILGIPAGTAHSRLHYAMRALRAAIDADTRPAMLEVMR